MMAHAAIFEGPGKPFRFQDLVLPASLAAGEVVVEVSLATICGSDLHTYEGRRSEAVPCVMGHEGIGRVTAAGTARQSWLGRRVTWSLADSCGHCAACTVWDLPQKCSSVFKYGHASLHEGSGLHGTYATHLVLREGTHLVELPDRIPDAVAAPANCSLATMANITENLPIHCRTAVVQGAGLLGLHGCALLREAGVARVIVVDTDPARLARAAAFGGEAASSTELSSQLADVVIEVAGDPPLLGEGLRLLRPGGHDLMAGMVHPESALDLKGESVIRGCVTIQGFHNYAPRHLEKAVSFLAGSTLPWASLVSPPVPLTRLDEAFALAAGRQWVRVAVGMR
jgi:putative phosphonate catabolism associated alcohol dehydrogenase